MDLGTDKRMQIREGAQEAEYMAAKTSSTIISEIVCSVGSCYFHTFQQRIRMLIF